MLPLFPGELKGKWVVLSIHIRHFIFKFMSKENNKFYSKWCCWFHPLGLGEPKPVQRFCMVQSSTGSVHSNWVRIFLLDSIEIHCKCEIIAIAFLSSVMCDKSVSIKSMFVYLILVNLNSDNPFRSTSVNFNSILTGLSAPCLIDILGMWSGSIGIKLIPLWPSIHTNRTCLWELVENWVECNFKS